MYLIRDGDGFFEQIMSSKQMYEMLIEEIIIHAQNNYEEYNILCDDLDQLGELAKNNLVNEKYIIDNLKRYGWHVINIIDIKIGLNELREYAARQTTPNLKSLDDIIKYLDEELK